MDESIQVKRADVDAIVRATFPSYRGRKFSVVAVDGVTLMDLNWSGGTRSQYRACTLDGSPLGTADRFNAMAPWSNPAEGVFVPLVSGAVIVEYCQFCGSDLGLRIHVHPSDMPRYLTSEVQS